MSIIKGWSFGKEHGYSGSAEKDKVPVRAHERTVQHFAKGGKVEKSTTPPPRQQRHYDRMENFRKEKENEPASPAVETEEMKKGGKTKKKYAEGGSVKKNLSASHKLGIPGGDGTKNVVGFKKGGKAKGKSGAANKAAGALAQIAAAASQSAPMGAAPGGSQMPMPPPGMPSGGAPQGAPPGMKRGGKSKKK